MPTTSEVLTAILFCLFSCFHIVEAHLDVICPQKWHFRWHHD